MWSVQDAKSHLSELMRRARAGEPQAIGMRDGCVLISAEAFRQWNENHREPSAHPEALTLGQQLLALSPGIDDFVLPERGSGRPNPFEELDDAEA